MKSDGVGTVDGVESEGVGTIDAAESDGVGAVDSVNGDGVGAVSVGEGDSVGAVDVGESDGVDAAESDGIGAVAAAEHDSVGAVKRDVAFVKKDVAATEVNGSTFWATVTLSKHVGQSSCNHSKMEASRLSVISFNSKTFWKRPGMRRSIL